MPDLVPLEPVDYLVIGHIAHDLTPDGLRLGGTAAYSALTAWAMGLRVGVVTASTPDTPLESFDDDIVILSIESTRNTTFENIYTQHGRVQYLRTQATRIDFSYVPENWRSASIIHLGPIANEMDSFLPKDFSPSLLGITPQGWMRQWNSEGLVSMGEWKNADSALARAGAVVLSCEDVCDDEELIEYMAHQTRILALTEGAAGCVLYWNGDRRRFRAPQVHEVDATGAGDIFATAFFVRLLNTRDPWEAARFATLIASNSVTRVGLDGVPKRQEIERSMIEVLQ